MRRDEPVIRPGAIILTLVLMGISTLFAGLCAAYLYTLISREVDAPMPPVVFLINIPVLLFATILLRKSLDACDQSLFREMLRYQLLCATTTLIFITLQIIGWRQFFANIPLQASQSRSFLFVLSALHLLHVLAGIPFLASFIWKSRNTIQQLYTDIAPFRGYLKGLVRYWNYLDILWILLVLILTIGYILKWL